MKCLRFCLMGLMMVGIWVMPGCKKDSTFKTPDNTDSLKGTFAMNISAQVRGQVFALNNPYFDVLSYKYKLSTLMFYVSHMSLIKDDNTLQEVDTVSLADYSTVAFGQPIVISGKVPEGHYKGVKFWIGIDSARNHGDPTVYSDPNSPLNGTYHPTYWDWNSGYKFIQIEGAVDSVPGNTNVASQPPVICQYHLATDALYREVDMPAHGFTVVKQQQIDYNVVLDVNKIFYTTGDTIVIYQEPRSQTTDHNPLAVRLTNNFSHAFSEQ